MAPIIIETVVGDTAPDVTFTCSRDDDTIIDLTACTVRFKIQDPKTKTRTNDASNTCAITDAHNGKCIYSWTDGGTDCPDVGTYRAILQITHPDTSIESIPVRIEASEGV